MLEPNRGDGGAAEMLEKSEEKELVRKALEEGCCRSQTRLIMAYRPLVHSMARKWARWNGPDQDPTEADLSQVGLEALTAALFKFDPDRGLRLGTFARHRIQGAMSTYVLNQGGPVPIGKNVAEKRAIHNFTKVRDRLERRDGRPIDEAGRAEIAEILNVSTAVIKRVETRLEARDIAMEAPVASGDDGGEALFSDVLADDSPTPDVEVTDKQWRERVSETLAGAFRSMPEDIRTVMQRRWQDPGKKPSLQALSQELSIGREHVRQLEIAGLNHLREVFADAGLMDREVAEMLSGPKKPAKRRAGQSKADLQEGGDIGERAETASGGEGESASGDGVSGATEGSGARLLVRRRLPLAPAAFRTSSLDSFASRRDVLAPARQALGLPGEVAPVDFNTEAEAPFRQWLVEEREITDPRYLRDFTSRTRRVERLIGSARLAEAGENLAAVEADLEDAITANGIGDQTKYTLRRSLRKYAEFLAEWAAEATVEVKGVLPIRSAPAFPEPFRPEPVESAASRVNVEAFLASGDDTSAQDDLLERAA